MTARGCACTMGGSRLGRLGTFLSMNKKSSKVAESRTLRQRGWHLFSGHMDPTSAAIPIHHQSITPCCPKRGGDFQGINFPVAQNSPRKWSSHAPSWDSTVSNPPPPPHPTPRRSHHHTPTPTPAPTPTPTHTVPPTKLPICQPSAQIPIRRFTYKFFDPFKCCSTAF